MPDEIPLSLADLLSAGKLFPQEWNSENALGPLNQLVEQEEGRFTLHCPSTVIGGQDVMYFDHPSGMFGRATFVKEDWPSSQWKNIGEVTPGSPDGRLDQLKTALRFVTRIDGMLYGQGRHDEIITGLRPRIDHIVRSAYELPGTTIEEIDNLVLQFPQSMKFDIPADSI